MDGVMDGISTRLARVGCVPRCLFCFGKAARQLRSPAGHIPTPLRLPQGHPHVPQSPKAGKEAGFSFLGS